MKKKNKFLLLSIMLNIYCFTQNPAIILAPNYAKYVNNDFEIYPLPTYGANDGNPLTGYDGQKAMYSQNIQVNNEGEIVFFIVDENIYDRNGKFLDKMRMVSDPNSITYNVNGYGSEVMVIPAVNEGNCVTTYYIFSSYNGEDFGNQALPGVVATYSILDIEYTSDNQVTANSGLRTMFADEFENEYNYITLREVAGDENYMQNSNSDHLQHTRLSANQLDNGEFLVIVENLGILVFFNIDTNGNISFLNNHRFYNSDLGFNWGDTNQDDKIELESVRLENGNIRIGVNRIGNINNQNQNGIYCIDIDQNGQFIENSVKFAGIPFQDAGNFNTLIKGFEFSPNGNKLYTSKTLHNGYTNTLDMFDLSQTFPSPQIIDIPGVNENDYEYSQIESGIGGSILIVSNDRISRIANANNPTFPQDFDDNVLDLSNYQPVQEFPENYHFKVRLMQDQIDVFDYAQVYMHDFDKITYTATSSATWMPNQINQINNPITNSTSSTVYIKEELRIPSNINITIKDMTFKFAPGARVVVEDGSFTSQGGKLILDNTTFTVDNSCELDLWNGVTVEGQDIPIIGSGYLELKNNSMIEHAWVGASTEKRGKIVTKNSTFLNNHVGVRINTSNNINSSNFYKTTFNWDDNIIKAQEAKFLVHISMNNTRGPIIRNNYFYNNISSFNPSGHFERGIGIQGVNATFSALPDCNDMVDLTCPTGKKNMFRNLEYGVNVTNYDGRYFQVDFSDMSNCKTGIFTRYAQNERINRNKIAIREHGDGQKYGIVLENSKGYMVEENYLTYYDNPLISNADAKTFGVVIRESGEEHNEIYKNSFDNLFVGSQAEGVNGYLTTTIDDHRNGFQWLCNKFTHNIYKNDIVVAKGRVDLHQGTPVGGTNYQKAIKTARNRFSLVGEPMLQQHDIQLINSENSMAYYHLSDANQTPDSYTYMGLNIVSPHEQSTDLYYDESYCPSSFEIPGPIGKSQLVMIKEQLDILLNKWLAGDAESLLEYIKTQPNKSKLKKELDKYSPYVSDRIINAYIDRIPSVIDLVTVLMSNSSLSNAIKDRINGMNIPNGLKKAIAGVQLGKTPREKLSEEISYLRAEYQRLENKYLSYLESDTLKFDSLKIELGNSDRADFHKKLLDISLSENNTEKINEQILWLQNKGVSNDYIQLANLRRELSQYSSFKTAFEQDNILAQNIISIANTSNDKESKNMAQSIVEMANDSMYIVPYVESAEDLLGAKVIYNGEEQEKVQINYQENVAKIYPNPSTGTFVIDLVNEPLGNLEVEILDMSGKKVYTKSFENTNSQVINLDSLSNGMYLVNIKHNETTIETQKLEIRNK